VNCGRRRRKNELTYLSPRPGRDTTVHDGRYKAADMTCIFCQIISGEAPAAILWRDDLVTAFRDAHPIASTHILIVPNRHIASINEIEASDIDLLGHMLLTAKELAVREGVAEKGYRLIFNTGRDGGQSVFHLHLHLLAGRLARFSLK
jgi:histidine triad (HIT) family protein